MKKLFMLALVAIFAGNAMALENVPKTGLTWIGYVGMNASGLSNSVLNGKAGLNVGFKGEYVLPNAYGTYINAGVNWSMKGGKKEFFDPSASAIDGTSVATKYTVKYAPSYLEIPIHVGFRYNINTKFGVYGELGPYFAIGVTGKGKCKYDNDLVKDESFMFFGKNFDFDNMKGIQRFDCGFGFRVGAEYNNQYSLNLGYDWGFTDMFTDKYRTAYAIGGGSLPKMKNHNLSITFGYRF